MKKILIAYCMPYLVVVYLITYYFDYVVQQYPVFLPPIVLILILALIYIGLGCMCGKQSLSKICVIGTVLQLLISNICFEFILPIFYINTGEINAWFTIIAGFVVVCQLIGYWGMKEINLK